MDLSRLVEFRGRIRRLEWWLIHLSVSVLVSSSIIAIVLSYGTTKPADGGTVAAILGVAFLGGLLSLAANVKRLHDLDRTGWLVIVLVVFALIPYVGWLVTLVVCGCLPGTLEANRFGRSPEELKNRPLVGLFHD